VPLIIRMPGRRPEARRVDDLVNSIDIGPTILEMAGIEVPEEMRGRSLLPILQSDESGTVDPERARVFCGRERHGPSLYPMRSVRTPRYLYIRNLEPEAWEELDNFGLSGDGAKILRERGPDDPAYTEAWQYCFGKRPAEELYDVQNDRYQLHNLADNPEHQQIREQLSKELTDHLSATGDPRMKGPEAAQILH
jgi:arylsulfatase A-like enzyme